MVYCDDWDLSLALALAEDTHKSLSKSPSQKLKTLNWTELNWNELSWTELN